MPFDHYHPDDHPDFTRDTSVESYERWSADLINRMVNVERKLRQPMWNIKKGEQAPTYTAEDLWNLANELSIPTPLRERFGLPALKENELRPARAG